MLTRVWQGKGYDKNARVEEHKCSDGTMLYSLRDRLGNPHNINDYEEAMKIVKNWGMEEATEQYINMGWIGGRLYNG